MDLLTKQMIHALTKEGFMHLYDSIYQTRYYLVRVNIKTHALEMCYVFYKIILFLDRNKREKKSDCPSTYFLAYICF